jgi:hypothetical protein
MTWDMIMTLPIQERRAMIRKHNMEQDEMERQFESDTGSGSDTRKYEGELINDYARLEQNNQRSGF